MYRKIMHDAGAKNQLFIFRPLRALLMLRSGHGRAVNLHLSSQSESSIHPGHGIN